MRRLLTACLLAILAAMPLAALTESAQAPTWPSTRVDRESQEGEAVTIGFLATVPDGQTVSYSATGLPRGLSINAATGVVSGTLAQSDAGTVNTNGSAGVHTNVTITATSSTGASSSYVFNWRVSRFKTGDVFAGVGGGKYRVFSDQGVFKYELTVETGADFVDTTGNNYGWYGGTTTGCGYNWVTRKMYFTQFDDDYDPTVAEIDPVPSGGVLVRSPLIRTFRDAGLERGGAATGYPIDGGPESVVFGTDYGPDGVFGTGDDVPGTMYVGHALGYYRPADELNADINDNAIIGTDDWSSFYYVDAAGNYLLDNNGQRILYTQGYSMDGFLSKYPGQPWLGQNGLPVSPLVQFGRDIQKWLPNGSGGWVRGRPVPDAPLVSGGPPREGYDTHSGWQGSDWLDLAADQRTMYYTSEWGTVYRFDVGPNPPGGVRQLAAAPSSPDPDAPKIWPYATISPSDPANPAPRVFYALRLLPPGDGSGGVLVAQSTALLRINEAGTVVNQYDADVDGWFALNISPDGRSVWSASTQNGRIYRWNIATARLESLAVGGTSGFASGATAVDGRYSLDGMCVMGEYTAAQEVCGDGIDNDEDGEVDEVCQAIEACSLLSPGDDDGDGLVDTNDPDCPGTVNVCAATGFTDPSVAGYCARFNREGDNVSLSPAPGPPPQANQREVFTISGLPPGITAGANGVLTGVPNFTILRNTDTPDTVEYDVLYEVRRETLTGTLVAEYDQGFTWTIQNVNRPPVAADFTGTIRPGRSQAFTLSTQTGNTGTGPCPAPGPVDPDCEDTVTITNVTTPSTGTLTSSGSTYTWTAPPTFTGVVTYEYTISDGRGGTDTGVATINVVNTPPVAVTDPATIRPGQTIPGASIVAPINVTANDTDADGDTLTVIGFTTPQGQVVQSGANGQFFSYTAPPAPFTGVDVFNYTVSDGYGGTTTASVRITIVNTPPVANDDAGATRPGTPVEVNVLANDTDADTTPTPNTPDSLSITAFTQPANGTVTASGSNAFVYQSTAGFIGVDAFTYTITDGWGAFDTATVTVTVANRPPVATDDTVPAVIAGQQVPPFNVLTIGTPDSDPDGDTISVTSFTQPGAGTVVHDGNGQFTWTAPNGYSGVTTFTYTITDAYGLTDTATVTITVRNLPPVAVNDSATTAGTQPVVIAVMQNDSDPDSHVISVTGATTPANGAVVVNANGTITYTANAGFQGTDTFFYTIKDGFGGESTATVTVTVGPPNRFDPCLCASAKASPSEIWPPNHKKTEVVTITDLADPDGGPLDIRILGIYQDEPTDYLGDGDTEIDGGGVGTSQAWVRAERTGNPNVPGNGRVYEIVFEATAEDGSSCRGSVFTGVPHDQGQGNYIYDDGIRYDSTVAGGPIVRNALKVENGLTDADIADRGFEAKYVAEARIGGSSSGGDHDDDDDGRRGRRDRDDDDDGGDSSYEMLIGPTVGATNDTEDFNWSSGSPAYFLLWKIGDTVHFKLLTSNQFEYVSYSADCANGECNDIFLRAEAGGTGTITLSSLNINGIAISETLTIPVGGEPRALHLSGLSMGEGVLLGGLVKIEWTSPQPTGSTVNFRVMVGSACPTETGGGGGGTGTPPLARSDSYSTNEDTPLSVAAASGILINDLTFAGPLSASLVSTTSQGSLSLSADGSFTYTPSTNFNGQDSFTYRVSDGNLQSEPALVTITVNPAVDPPTAVDDSATTNENTAVTIPVTGNDSDPFGATLAISALTQPLHGTSAVSGTSIAYTPSTGYIGTDTFTYTVTGTEGTATATVTVTVVNVNEPPVAVNNAYTTAEDTPLTIAAPGILANDSDPDAGDTLAAVLVTGPSNGTVTQNGDGSFVYTPAANFSGVDSYTYRARDAGGLESNVATVSITITTEPDPPLAVDDSYVVSEDGVLQINAPGVKSNDSDPDTAASALTVSVVTGVQRGSLTLNADGSFVYTPYPDVTGSDSFVYQLTDGVGSSNATATIAVTDEPDPPVAVDDAASTGEDTPVTINVLGNDSDPDTPTLTLQSVTQPGNGQAVILSGQVRYTPAEDFAGQDTFTYTISDGTSTATATVVVTVTSVNDPPVAVDDAYTTTRNSVLNVQTAEGVLVNDSDPEGQQMTARVVTQPTSGSVVFQTHGAFSYTPPNGFTGTATFTYRVNDGTSDSNIATVTINVNASNDPPVAVNDSYTTDKNVPLTIDAPGILGNDSDPNEDDALTAVLISGTAANTGTVTLNANGSFTYTPATDYTGTTTFRYRARDEANAQSNEAIVSIEVEDATTSGQVCYDGGPGKTHLRVQIDWAALENGDIRARATVSRNYADNTYGVNKIGWRNHSFRHIYTSDFGQLAFYDANGTKRLDFKIDYLSPLSGTPSGYGSKGILGGKQADGGMVSGSASNIVSMATSIDLNMNAFGYVSTASNHPLKRYSPPTNGAYTPNASYPQWIWDVWYEATVRASTFGSSGFGTVTLRDLHASPAKEEVNNWRLINCQ